MTVTVKFATGPSQPFAWGVTWYVTVAGDAVVLVSRSLIVVTLVDCSAVKPVTDPTGVHDAVQVKSPPETSGRSEAENVVPEHNGAGVGFTR